MLKFVPVNSNELNNPFSNDETVCGYVGFDLNDNSKCGECAFRINGYSMEILYVEAVDNDAETIEGLIRSALNYGGNRNVYIAIYNASSGVDVAEMLGFENEGGKLSGDIPTLLKGSCCKGKQEVKSNG